MSSVVDSKRVYALADLPDLIPTLLFNGFAREEREQFVNRLEICIESFDLLTWLENQVQDQKVYWTSRDKGFEVAAIGAADLIQGDSNTGHHGLYRTLDQTLCKLPKDVRYYGGTRFADRGEHDRAWRDFGEFWFVLPRFEVLRKGSKTVFACHLMAGEEREKVLQEFQALLFDLSQHTDDKLPIPESRVDEPDSQGWSDNVTAALDLFEQGTLDKIVLARKTSLTFDIPLNPYALLNRLRHATPECFHFCLQPCRGVAFVGASPERLFMRSGLSVETESVAGTRPRGKTSSEDDRIGDELLASGKDLREHFFVRDEIWETMEPFCETLVKDKKVSLLKLAQGQHLFTRFRGDLNENVKNTELLQALHPTPAVGGCPTESAIHHITRLEPFDRGFYASPVGWVGRNGAEFAVAIRSGLIEKSRLSIFSGAGIVQGSTPEMEWSEIENKIADFIKVLTSI